VRSVVTAMTAYALELREAEVKLNQNESASDFPDTLKTEVMRRAAARSWNRYPDFESTALREALALAYALDPAGILVGNGSNELLAASMAALVGPGTPVILPRPTFTLYEKLIAIAGGLVVPVDLDPRTGVIPVPEIVDAARGLDDAVVIICSPNNPTGGVLPPRALETLTATGATVLFDRAYGEFANDGGPQPVRDGLVTFSTFSKAWGLAALRIGWLSTTPQACREIRKVRLPYNLNVFSATAAQVALENPERRDETVREVIAERERLYTAMRSMVDTFPSEANFIAFRPDRNCHEVFEGLAARGVLVRDISAFHHMTNCLRVSIGSRQENDRFLAALEESI
jgi:histidinol-phosphate aminotransferase